MADPREDLEKLLREVVPGLSVSGREVDRVSYARDLWPRHHLAVRDGELPSSRPGVIAWPRTAEEVARIVRRCGALGVPVAPFGAGSGVCGGTLPDARTVLLDLKRLGRMTLTDRSVHAEAGVLGIRLEEDLNARGYTLGHFPSSILCSTVGGWVAARSAGQCSGLYGKIEDMVVSLDCVLGTGEPVRLTRRLNGPDLTPLITGSEGILAVVTSAELRLHPSPSARSFASLSFDTVEEGLTAIRAMFQAGLRPAVCRLYDGFDSMMARRGSVSKRHDRGKVEGWLRNAALRTMLRAPTWMNGLVEAVGDRGFGGAMLVLVFEGDISATQADAEKARRMSKSLSGKDLGERPARHWFAHRYAVSYRQAPVFISGAFSDTMEVSAPWANLVPMFHAVREAMSRHVFVMAHFSHAYPDGASIYFTFAGSGRDRAEAERLYDRTWDDAMSAVMLTGGSLSHHHGVGRSKAPRLGEELGLGVQIVSKLCGALDPAGIMNPGNLLPEVPPVRPREPARVPSVRKPEVDDVSQLVFAHGETRLSDLEFLLRSRGFTLDLEAERDERTVGAWIAEGGTERPGHPDAWTDPVDHYVAGFVATLASGEELSIRPSPRRAVGPDLLALFWGTRGAVGQIRGAHLRFVRVGVRARPLPTSIERNPPISDDERATMNRVFDACRRAQYRPI